MRRSSCSPFRGLVWVKWGRNLLSLPARTVTLPRIEPPARADGHIVQNRTSPFVFYYLWTLPGGACCRATAEQKAKLRQRTSFAWGSRLHLKLSISIRVKVVK
jgi:hypothetical protein